MVLTEIKFRSEHLLELYLLQRCQVWWSCRTLEVPECWIGYLLAFDGWDVFFIPIHLQISTKSRMDGSETPCECLCVSTFFSHTIEACPVTSGCLCQRDVAPFRANLSNDLDEEMGNRQRRFCIWHGKPMRCAGDLW